MRRKSKLRQRTDVLLPLLDAFIEKHPLPWRIEYDHTVEVRDSRGNRCISFSTAAQAELFIRMAKSCDKERRATEALMDEINTAFMSEDGAAVDRILEKPLSYWHEKAKLAETPS